MNQQRKEERKHLSNIHQNFVFKIYKNDTNCGAETCSELSNKLISYEKNFTKRLAILKLESIELAKGFKNRTLPFIKERQKNMFIFTRFFVLF